VAVSFIGVETHDTVVSYTDKYIIVEELKVNRRRTTSDLKIYIRRTSGGLIWVKGWYQGRYGKIHVIIFLSHILHWPFPSIDFYIANKIFELTNSENKSLRELPSWADPGFQVRGGGAFKKIGPSGGRREQFWGISCEKSRFYAKNHFFSNFRGGLPPPGCPPPPGSAPVLCSTCKYFCFDSGFKNIPNNVALNNDVRNCL
jgi:hypothetical protein